MKVVALAGGTGSSKLLRGLSSEIGRFTVVANVGDNAWIHGLYVCPDVDTALYALAGIGDRRKGWGVAGDTFNALSQLSRLGAETWFNLGDRDIALHVIRTKMLGEGKSLTAVTTLVSKALGVIQTVLPATDASVETRIVTAEGDIHLQEFWVKRKGRVRVKGVRYLGASRALPTNEVAEAIRGADKIIICPANPVTSITPMLELKRMKALIASSGAEKVGVSPMIGSHPFSGPAGRLMRALGRGSDSVAVARMYSPLIDKFVIDNSDARMREKIEELGVKCLTVNTQMSNHRQERRLARTLVEG